MPRKPALRPECLADSLPSAAVVQEAFDAALDGNQFLAELYKTPIKDIEKMDMRRTAQGATSFAVKEVALAYHNKLVAVAAAVGARPSDILRFGKSNLGVMGSTAEKLISKIKMHAELFESHGLTKAESVSVVLKQSMMPHHTRGTEEAILWLKDIVKREVVRPSGTLAEFIGTYFSNARLGPDAREFMETVAILQKQQYGKPMCSLARISKSDRAETLKRLRAHVGAMPQQNRHAKPAPRARKPKAAASKSAAKPAASQPKKEKPVWQLVEEADEHFTLVAPALNCAAPPQMVLSKRNGRLLRYLIQHNSLSGTHRTAAMAEANIQSDDLFDYAVKQATDVVRALRRRTPGRPALIVNKTDGSGLCTVGSPVYINRAPKG